VTWVAPDDGGSAITGYLVTAYLSPSGTVTTHTCTGGPTATTCNVTGLTNGTAYTFEVVASNLNGDSPASPPSAAVTPSTVPAAPAKPTAVAGDVSAQVTWVAPDDGGSAITGYLVTAYLSPSGTVTTHTCTGGPSDTTCNVTGLTNGTAYTFEVVASNVNGPSPASPASDAVTPSTVPGNQTITFVGPSDQRLDQTPVAISASASSLLSVSFSSTTPSVCTVSGGSVTLLTHGTCTIHATQAGDADWNAATPVDQSFTVNPGNQTVAFTSTAPVSAVVNGTTYTPTAHATSGLTAAITVDSSALSICSISAGVVSFQASGFCVLDANQAGDGTNWNAAAQAQQSFAVVGVPGAPTGVTGVGLDGKAQISWTAPANNGGAPITKYHVVSTPLGSTCDDTVGALTCVVTGLADHTAYTFTVTAYNIAGPGPASSASSNVVPRVGATYFPLVPSRVLDTAHGVGHTGALSPNQAVTFQVTGLGGSTTNVPAYATAVTGMLSASGSTSAGYLALTPVPNNNPNTSNLNFPKGDTRATGVTVPLNPNGSGTLSVTLGATSGTKAQAAFDVTGYFVLGTSGSTYFSVTPNRLLDTRSGLGTYNGKKHTVLAGSPITLQVTGGTTTVPTGATAVTGNLTVTDQSKKGCLTLTPQPTPSPSTVSLCFPTGDNRATGVTVGLDSGGKLYITYTAAAGATTDVVFDVTGFFVKGTAGAMYVPVTPARIMDTRTATRIGPNGKLRANVSVSFPVTGHGGVPSSTEASQVVSVTGTLTVTDQTYGGLLALTTTRISAPTTSTLNFPKGDNRATGVTVPLGSGGVLWIVFVPKGTTDAIFDVSGYFVQ
jgi:hypothetical protein